MSEKLKVIIEQVMYCFQEYMETERTYTEAHKSYKFNSEQRTHTYKKFREAEQKAKIICDVLNLDFYKCMSLTRGYLKWANKTEWQIWFDTQNKKNYERLVNYLIRNDDRKYNSYYCNSNNKNMKSNEYLLFMNGVISEWAKRSMKKEIAV